MALMPFLPLLSSISFFCLFSFVVYYFDFLAAFIDVVEIIAFVDCCPLMVA
jgi:hypothetical protein